MKCEMTLPDKIEIYKCEGFHNEQMFRIIFVEGSSIIQVRLPETSLCLMMKRIRKLLKRGEL